MAPDPLTNGTYTNGNPSNARPIHDLDALIVGAGFAGCYQLKTLRDLGYKVLLVEWGFDYGGVWYWNRYPGARVDSSAPHYQFSDTEIWKDFSYSERFPDSAELRRYFAHVAERWDLRRDTKFGCFVQAAEWVEEGKWIVRTKEGERYRVKWLSLNLGFAAKRHVPDWKGIDTFKGTILHPSFWPHEEPDLNGKKIAIIGVGSTGVQLIQSLSKKAGQLTVFQRTHNTATPLRQETFSPNGTTKSHSPSELKSAFNARTTSFAGFDYNFIPRATFDDPPSQRLAIYEQLWASGDFKFQLANYQDLMFSEAANRSAYNFWRDKTRARIRDPQIADVLAPMQQQYAFGCKRIPLEVDYFEAFNEPHVKLVDLKATPVEEVTEKGIKTSAGEMEFDYIICATGCDAVTGGLAQIEITGVNGEMLTQHWEGGFKTYLGMAMAGFPNLFFSYGVQAPTALCNGPTCAELQGKWIADVMEHMKTNGFKKMVARGEAEKEWKKTVLDIANSSLLPRTQSWYMGDNIPGKPREPLFYLGGFPSYYKTLNEVAVSGYTGFDLS